MERRAQTTGGIKRTELPKQGVSQYRSSCLRHFLFMTSLRFGIYRFQVMISELYPSEINLAIERENNCQKILPNKATQTSHAC